MRFTINWAEKHPYIKLILFGILLLFSSILFSSFAIFLSNLLYGIDLSSFSILINESSNDPKVLNSLKLIQVINAVGIFFVPAILLSHFLGENPTNYLKLNFKFKNILFLLTILLILISSPFTEWILTLNQSMTLPDSLHSMEQWMKNSEEQARKITLMFLQMSSLTDFLITLVIVALLPALGEEILFRGVLLRLFHEWSKNIHVAILISGILFSAIHMQFFGFFPRMLLGVMFGYLFYWSGSLWVPVIAHFVNNGAAVTVGYLNHLKIINVDINEPIGYSAYFIISSLILTSLVLFIFYKKSKFIVNDPVPITDLK